MHADIGSEKGDKDLPTQEHRCGGDEDDEGVLVVEDAEGDDEDDGNRAGEGVEEIELWDGEVVELLNFLLEGLGLIENVVVGKHHEDEDQTTINFLHRFVIIELNI